MYYFFWKFQFLCFYYTNALADLQKNAFQICDIYKCTCIYMTKLLFRIETVVQMNLKGCKSLLYSIQTVQYFRLQIYNMDFMNTQFIYVYNYLLGSYWIGLEKCWSLCHDVLTLLEVYAVCNENHNLQKLKWMLNCKSYHQLLIIIQKLF